MGFGDLEEKGKGQKAQVTMSNRFEDLDRIAEEIRQRSQIQLRFLGSDDFLYVCLAADRTDLMDEFGFTVPAALLRLGPDWTAALVQRHQYQLVNSTPINHARS